MLVVNNNWIVPKTAPRLVFNPFGRSLDDQQLVQELACDLESVYFFVWKRHFFSFINTNTGSYLKPPLVMLDKVN